MGRHLLVHSVHFTTEPIKAKTDDGHDVEGQMPVAIIELVCPKGIGKSIPHKERALTEDDRAYIAATFPLGGIVEQGDFKLVKAPESEAEAEGEEMTITAADVGELKV